MRNFKKMAPLISIIICTYNGENLIKNCLDSILNQNFKNFEIICVDGGSKDKTPEIIKNYIKKDKRIRLVINEKKLPEGKGYGKWLGYKNARGEIFGIIDQDNEIQRKDLFFKVAEIFNKNKSLAGILGEMKYDLSDKKITRYISIVGTDSFFAYRSMDFLKNIQNLGEKIILKEDNLPITGGNCFFYRKKDLELIGGYTQDILAINELVKNKKNAIALIKNSTKHYAETSFFNLIKKKFRWGKSFGSDKKLKKFDYFPKTRNERKAFIRNLFFCFLIIPNFIYSIKLYKKFKEGIAFLFPIIAFFNALAYFISYLFYK